MKILVRKMGEEQGIVLPDSVLEQLGTNELELEVVGRSVILRPDDHKEDAQEHATKSYLKVKERREKLLERYGKVR